PIGTYLPKSYATVGALEHKAKIVEPDRGALALVREADRPRGVDRRSSLQEPGQPDADRGRGRRVRNRMDADAGPRGDSRVADRGGNSVRAGADDRRDYRGPGRCRARDAGRQRLSDARTDQGARLAAQTLGRALRSQFGEAST